MDGHEQSRTDEGLRLLIDLMDADPVDSPSDPLEPLTLRALTRLARRAHRRRMRNADRFQQLAVQADVPVRRLRLLADAWGVAGRSGVSALGPAVTVDPQIMERAREVVEAWRRRHHPLDALATDVWRNRMTIRLVQPGNDPTADQLAVPLAQVRRTPDGTWHLYRRAIQGEWWPVRVAGRDQTVALSGCLEVIRVDALGLFWGQESGEDPGSPPVSP